MLRMTYTLIFFLWISTGQAWNMQGHQLVAQIAYDNLSPNAKKLCDHYLRLHSNKSLDIRFVRAAT